MGANDAKSKAWHIGGCAHTQPRPQLHMEAHNTWLARRKATRKDQTTPRSPAPKPPKCHVGYAPVRRLLHCPGLAIVLQVSMRGVPAVSVAVVVLLFVLLTHPLVPAGHIARHVGHRYISCSQRCSITGHTHQHCRWEV